VEIVRSAVPPTEGSAFTTARNEDAVVEQAQKEDVLNLANHVAILDTAIVGDADIAGNHYQIKCMKLDACH